MGFIRICNLHCLTFGEEKYVEENDNNLFIINFGNILNKELYICIYINIIIGYYKKYHSFE